MIDFFNAKYLEMENNLKSISKDNIIESLTTKIQIVEDALENLKLKINKKPFLREIDEIEYFKNLKPNVIAQLVFYKRLLQIELEKPHGSIENKITHLESELNRLTRYCNANIVFVQYIRSGKTYLDNEYFIRKNAKIHQMTESFSSEIDYSYGTGFDFRLGTLLALNKIESHIQEQIDALKNPNLLKRNETFTQYDIQLGKKKLKWTGTHSDLVELIYGLYISKTINNGNIDIKEITAILEQLFDINLTNVYRTFIDIKKRKTVDRFTFISSMIEQLEILIEDEFIPKNNKS